MTNFVTFLTPLPRHCGCGKTFSVRMTAKEWICAKFGRMAAEGTEPSSWIISFTSPWTSHSGIMFSVTHGSAVSWFLCDVKAATSGFGVQPLLVNLWEANGSQESECGYSCLKLTANMGVGKLSHELKSLELAGGRSMAWDFGFGSSHVVTIYNQNRSR